jgi:hypothetical protein
MAGGVEIEMPRRLFLFTLDQVATLVSMPEERLKRKLCWFRGRSTFVRNKDMLAVHNIAQEDMPPDWRVEESELTRWLKRKGFNPV